MSHYVQNREPLLGQFVVGWDAHIPPTFTLSNIGIVANVVIQNTSANCGSVSIEKYVIMPNHIHLLITITPDLSDTDDSNSKSISLHTIIRSFKTLVSKKMGFGIWQDSYYDHIIRDEADYRNVWEYIEANPDKWQEDEYFK